MNKEEPAWKAELMHLLDEHFIASSEEIFDLVEPFIKAAEERGRQEAWNEAVEVADECAAQLHRQYESEQAHGAYAVLRDLRREMPQ